MYGTITAFEAVLKRDRAIVIGGLVAVNALAWLYILAGASMEMETMVGSSMMAMRPRVS